MVKYIAEESFKSTGVGTVLWTRVQWNLYSGDTFGTKVSVRWMAVGLGFVNNWPKNKKILFYSALESAAVIINFKQLDNV